METQMKSNISRCPLCCQRHPCTNIIHVNPHHHLEDEWSPAHQHSVRLTLIYLIGVFQILYRLHRLNIPNSKTSDMFQILFRVPGSLLVCSNDYKLLPLPSCVHTEELKLHHASPPSGAEKAAGRVLGDDAG